MGLHKENFRPFEDGTEQAIKQLFNQETPISIGFVFDASSSMTKKMEQSRLAIAEFLRMSMPNDEFFLMKFSDRPEPVQAFTRDPAVIEDAAEHIWPGGWTALYDARSHLGTGVGRASDRDRLWRR